MKVRTRRLFAVAIAALTLVAVVPPALATSRAGHNRPSNTIDRPAWLHVDHPVDSSVPRIVDSAGRAVLLRGVNANGVQDDYWSPRSDTPRWLQPFWSVDPAAYQGACPTNARQIVDPPLCEVDAGRPPYDQSSDDYSQNDFAQMRALGFNMVRLTLSWSSIEPRPGVYDGRYIDRVAQVVGWAGEQGIHVLLDMHQDSYSRFIDETAPASIPGVLYPPVEGGNHADGAPPWAIVADGAPSLAPGGVSELGLQSGAAFASFWLNRAAPGPQGAAPGTGLQDHTSAPWPRWRSASRPIRLSQATRS